MVRYDRMLDAIRSAHEIIHDTWRGHSGGVCPMQALCDGMYRVADALDAPPTRPDVAAFRYDTALQRDFSAFYGIEIDVLLRPIVRFTDEFAASYRQHIGVREQVIDLFEWLAATHAIPDARHHQLVPPLGCSVGWDDQPQLQSLPEPQWETSQRQARAVAHAVHRYVRLQYAARTSAGIKPEMTNAAVLSLMGAVELWFPESAFMSTPLTVETCAEPAPARTAEQEAERIMHFAKLYGASPEMMSKVVAVQKRRARAKPYETLYYGTSMIDTILQTPTSPPVAAGPAPSLSIAASLLAYVPEHVPEPESELAGV